jgi:hypothetical protein
MFSLYNAKCTYSGLLYGQEVPGLLLRLFPSANITYIHTYHDAIIPLQGKPAADTNIMQVLLT